MTNFLKNWNRIIVGSHVYGTCTDFSDLDLLIVFSDDYEIPGEEGRVLVGHGIDGTGYSLTKYKEVIY